MRRKRTFSDVAVVDDVVAVVAVADGVVAVVAFVAVVDGGVGSQDLD